MKCNYCNEELDSTLEKCPNCGAVNENFKRTGIGVPKTIDELKLWYEEHHLPPSNVTRFFIGEDIKEAKAFGIYKDENTGNFVVYKNKDTGVRAVRYEGTDEAYAVNELYLKLKDEIQNQKSLNNGNNKNISTKNILGNYTFFLIFAVFILIFVVISFSVFNDGYYDINGSTYYKDGSTWYIYNGDWRETSKPSYTGDLSDYSSTGSDVPSVRNSTAWDNNHDDWDSDSNWSSSDSDWDSGGTDWSSDW